MFNKWISLTAILTTAAFAQQPTLKDAFQGLFRIGAAVNQRQFEEKDPAPPGSSQRSSTPSVPKTS